MALAIPRPPPILGIQEISHTYTTALTAISVIRIKEDDARAVPSDARRASETTI